jgi:transposase InsO family protein
MSRQTPAGEATVTLLCRRFAISRQAYYAALKPAPARRHAEVRRLPTKPRHASAEAVLDAIKAVLAGEDATAWGVRKVWARLRQQGLRVGRKRVWALMHAHGLVLVRDHEPGETPRGHVAVPEPNRRLATDLTTVWTRRDGVVAIVPTIDCGCRSLLGMTVTKDQHGPAVLASVRQALVTAFGRPENVPDGVDLRTDHGPQYTGADCAALVTEWHLMHTYAPVGRPTGNAVVERVIRTLKEEVIWLRDWESTDEVRAAIEAWVQRYNHERPHQALSYATPAEYRAEKLGRPRRRAAVAA